MGGTIDVCRASNDRDGYHDNMEKPVSVFDRFFRIGDAIV
jgi:hypothetical protein